MSGNTIGGIAGGLIGFAIGGPAGAQWGWMIGSVVGGIVDPQTIQGAQWQNQQLQGSADGLGRAVIFGTATVTGNLLDAEPNGPRIGTRTERQGKGGPEVERDTAILTYAIEICDSSELRGTTVQGVIAVWEDEKLVYDVRPNGSGVVPGDRAATSSKWLANKTFYFGGEDQMPPPELEAIHGVGNVPAYRGSCIMVVHDEDLMVDIDDKPRGRIPTYRFLVSVCGVVGSGTARFLGTGRLAAGYKASIRQLSYDAAWLGPADVDVTGTIGTEVLGAYRVGDSIVALPIRDGFSAEPVRYSALADLTAWSVGATLVSTSTRLNGSVSGNRLFTCGYGATIHYIESASDASFTAGATASGGASSNTIYGLSGNGMQLVAYNQFGQLWGSSDNGTTLTVGANLFGGSGNQFYTLYPASDVNGTRFVIGGGETSGLACYTDDLGATATFCAIPANSGVPVQVKHCGNGNWLIACNDMPTPVNDGLLLSTDNGASFTAVNLPAQLFFNQQYRQSIAVDASSGRVVIFGHEHGSNASRAFYTDDFEAWTPISLAGTESTGIAELYPLGIYASTELPDSPGYYVDGDGNVIGPSVPVGTMCSAPLDQVVRKLHKLGAPQLSDAEFDLAALEGDTVRGYAIQDAAVTVAEACDPLRRVWTFDLPSYDGQIHAIKRGRDVDWTLPEDDLIAMDSDYEQSMQDDTVSLPRKLHLAYNDPNIDYKETTQISERYSADVRVVGEEKISMGQLVMTATEAKQAVVKQHKLAWLNAEDTRKLAAPLEYIGAVNSDIVQFRGRRYRVDQMRVEGLQVTFESAVYDRASSYQSTTVGTEGVPPPPMDSSLRGPTVSVFMNLPVLRDADDKAGIYWAASGMLEGWRGALLQMSRDGVTFENLNIAVPTPCTIGTLQADILSASRYGMDEVNQIMVKLNPLSTGLDSTDMDGLLREANSAAILYADGTAEIVQFLTATETAPREYTLSGLLRGRLDTTPGAHNAGAQFVLLNDAIRFVPLRNDDVGATITFRAISAGTVAENNDSVALTLGSFKSLAEWEPAMVHATTGTNEVSVTWAGRGRLGSSRMPVHSLNFDKYRVRVTKSGTTVTSETGNQYATVTYTGISEPYTTGVTALSRIDAQFNSPEGTA